MKKISLKNLKQDLSSWTKCAAGGEVIQVTRYSQPFVYISGAATDSPYVHVGKNVGMEIPKKITKKKVSALWLHMLEEDREN